MLKIGLTGGIGSGKTTVAKVFELLNIPVYYADEASKRLYQTDKELMAKIKDHFGEDVYADNQLNRAKLAALVFDKPDQLLLLNSLVHPPTIKDAQDWMNKQTGPYSIKEAALIFESGSNSGLDYVIGVKTPQHLRTKRVMERDGITREAVVTRMNRQMDEDQKMQLCDFIIENNEEQMIIPQVLKLHDLFLQKAKTNLVTI
jgi:dephospho-CoA kinase